MVIARFARLVAPLAVGAVVVSLNVLHTRIVGATEAAKSTPAEVILRLQETVPIETLAEEVTDPTSPRYRNFYSPEEIRARVAPSDAQYSDLLAKLRLSGIEIVSESPTHLFLTVRGPSEILRSVQTRTLSRIRNLLDFSGLALIQSVNGLDPSQKRHPHYKISKELRALDSNGISPADIKKLYGFDAIYNTGITGKGQHISIATYDGFKIDDVNQYYSLNNIKPGPHVEQIVFNGEPNYDMNSAAETQADAELSGMIATGAEIHVFASSQNSDAGELGMFTAILDDNRAKIVNYSWGSCETALSTTHRADMDKTFARAKAQGVNIMVASGDSGSDCNQDGTVAADYPASHPDIVAVGGTTLTDSNGTASETAWSGSGGGISTLYDLPSFQSNFAKPYLKRSYPDVAFNADPASGQAIWAHYDPMGGTPTSAISLVIGGTSIAAPQWSGFLALVGEARANGKPLGPLNPITYAIPSDHQTDYFHDVISGNNGAFKAGKGWDAVTGIGSMKAFELFTFLKNHQ